MLMHQEVSEYLLLFGLWASNFGSNFAWLSMCVSKHFLVQTNWESDTSVSQTKQWSSIPFCCFILLSVMRQTPSRVDLCLAWQKLKDKCRTTITKKLLVRIPDSRLTCRRPKSFGGKLWKCPDLVTSLLFSDVCVFACICVCLRSPTRVCVCVAISHGPFP